jgi:xanthosine utilization system XapX-like protein
LAAAGLVPLGVVYALMTGQIPAYDVTVLLIVGCCIGSLAGPTGFVLASRPRV